MDHTGAVIGPVFAIITLLVLFTGFNLKDPLLALRWTFVLALIPGILAVLTVIFFVREVSPGSGNSKLFKLSIRDFDKNFRIYLVIMIIFTLGNSSDAFLLFRVEEAIQKSGAVINFVHGIKPLHNMLLSFGTEENQAKVINILFLPLIWAFFHVIKVIFSTPMGSLSDRIGRKIVINIGWAIYTFVYISFALLVFLPSSLQLIATFILFAVYALFYAFSEGAEKAFVADLVKAEYRGTAFGMYNFAVGLGALPASIIFGFLWGYFDKLLPGYGGTVAFGFGGTIALVSMILLAIMVKEPNRNK